MEGLRAVRAWAPVAPIAPSGNPAPFPGRRPLEETCVSTPASVTLRPGGGKIGAARLLWQEKSDDYSFSDSATMASSISPGRTPKARAILTSMSRFGTLFPPSSEE